MNILYYYLFCFLIEFKIMIIRILNNNTTKLNDITYIIINNIIIKKIIKIKFHFFIFKFF